MLLLKIEFSEKNDGVEKDNSLAWWVGLVLYA